MIIQRPDEVAYLKDSETVLQKIEKIKTMLQELNCTSSVNGMRFEDNILKLDLGISFPVTDPEPN